MLRYLVSYLIAEQGYVHIAHYMYEHLSLIEFFDQVLVDSDEPKLCLIKEIDSLSMKELDNITRFGFEIAEKTRFQKRIRYQTLVFLVSERGFDPERVKAIESLDAFRKGSHFQPVFVDARTRSIQFNPWHVPLFHILMLTEMKKHLKKNGPAWSLSEGTLEAEEQKSIGKTTGFQRAMFLQRPYATWSLIAVNIIVWLVMYFTSGDIANVADQIRFGAKVNPLIWDGEYWRLVTAAFIHTGVFHLAFNCLFLLLLGSLIESFYGWWRLVLIYLVSAISGNLMSVVFSPYFSAGASSAVYGMVAALIVYGYKYRSDVSRHFFQLVMIFLGIFLITQVILAFVSPGTDNYAHLGGLLGSFFFTLVLGVRYPPNIPKKINWIHLALTFAYFILLITAATHPYHKAYTFYYFIVGSEADRVGDTSRAVTYLERCLDFDSTYEPARRSLAAVYGNLATQHLKKSQTDVALFYLFKAEKIIPRDEQEFETIFHIYELIGRCYDEKNDAEKAVRHFRYALAYKPDSISTRTTLAEQYFILARKAKLETHFDEAEKFASLSIMYAPKNEDVRLFLGALRFNRGDFFEAARTFKEAADLSDKNVKSEAALKRYIFKNLFDTPALRYHTPGKPQAATLVAEGEKILVISGNYRSALNKFELASKIDPNYTPALVNRGFVNLYLSKPLTAAEFARSASAKDGKNWEIQDLIGIIHAFRNETKEAREAFKKSVTIEPRNARAWRWLGTLQSSPEDIENSKLNLEKSRTLDPNNVFVHIELAKLHKKKSQKEPFWKEANTALVLASSQNKLELVLMLRTLLTTTEKH